VIAEPMLDAVEREIVTAVHVAPAALACVRPLL
jgi:hypothetical protein